MSEFDPIMRELLENPKNTVKYLSPTIQNELITTLSNSLERQLILEIKSAPFYSVIIDTTQDMAKVDQLSLTIRYAKLIHDESGRPKEVQIKETFLGFYECRSQTAANMSEQILQLLRDKQLSLDRCRGQGYDGASTMSGVYGGVQKRLLDQQPLAIYVHCATHNLNLVLNDAVSAVREVEACFTTMQELYVFFGHSIRRWDLLASITGESSVTLKRLNPTRWAGRLTSLIGIKHRYSDVVKALTRIILEHTSRAEREEAVRLKAVIQRFEFVLLIVVLGKVMSAINVASTYLQSRDADLFQARKHLKTAYDDLSAYRNDFANVVSEARRLCSVWGAETEFANKRTGKTKRHFDDLCEDSRLSNPEDRFRVSVYYRLIDTVTSQLSRRFTAMNEVIDSFSILFPANLVAADEDAIRTAAEDLQKRYSCDLTEGFPIQLLTFVASLKSEIVKLSTVQQLARLLTVEYAAMSTAFPDVVTALKLFLTLPVTVASAERSFSKLRLIKSYLRSTMNQDRLRSLALLSIEAQSAESLETDQIIDDFANAKARRKPF